MKRNNVPLFQGTKRSVEKMSVLKKLTPTIMCGEADWRKMSSAAVMTEHCWRVRFGPVPAHSRISPIPQRVLGGQLFSAAK